jgi:hypothetical protein
MFTQFFKWLPTLLSALKTLTLELRQFEANFTKSIIFVIHRCSIIKIIIFERGNS